jgi:hypothetical protein
MAVFGRVIQIQVDQRTYGETNSHEVDGLYPASNGELRKVAYGRTGEYCMKAYNYSAIVSQCWLWQ